MIDRFAALLNGEAVAWMDFAMRPDEFDRTCRERDLTCLIGERLFAMPDSSGWPAEILDRFAIAVRTETAKEMLRQRELIAVVDLLAAEGVRSIVTKGTAFAYGLYSSPAARPRIDTDLLIRQSDIAVIRRTMARLGYSAPPYCDGDVLFCQFPMRKIDGHGLAHTVDFHWRISTQTVFAGVLGFDEVDAEAVDLPALGRHARAPSLVHTLLLACIHPVMHHRNAELLIWTYDVHLIASRLTAGEFSRFAELAVAKHVSAICARQLARAQARFGTQVPDAVIAVLNTDRREPSSEYLRPNRGWRDEFISSLRGLPRWKDRVRLVREVMLPARSYMLAAYRIRPSSPSAALLPALYVHRLAAGVLKIVIGRK